MKKNSLLLAAVLTCGVAFTQTETYISETGGVNDPIVYMDANNQDGPPCGENNDSNAFENGKSCTYGLNRIVAHDFTVDAGEALSLENIIVNVFIGATGSGVHASFLDIYYYEDDNGSPGAMIGGEFSFFPILQDVVGTNYGFDVWQIEMDVEDRVFHSSGGAPKTYWIGLTIEATDGSNLFWENSTIGLTGSGEAYDNGGGAGYVIDSTLEGVYTFTGDCMLLLGVDDDDLANRLNIYPNPVSDGLVNIETSIPGEKEVIVFDILGKKIIDTVVQNTQMNVSSLGAGVYMLQVTQGNATAIKKLIVK